MTEPGSGERVSTRSARRSGGFATVRRTAATLAWLIGLLTGLGMAQAPAWALPQETLTPAAIAEFEQKLNTARAEQAIVANRLVCFEKQDAALVQERDADQRRLGDLVGRKRDLEAKTNQQRSEYDGFLRLYQEEYIRHEQLRQELNRNLAYKRSLDEAVDKCKRDAWIFGFVCELSKAIGQAMGLIEETGQKINVAARRIEHASAGMNQANENYRQSAEALAQTQEEASRTEREIRTAEASISRLQATLAVLRPEVHDSKLLLDEFDNALNEAKGDGRERSARRLRTVAGRVDESTLKSNALLAHARSVLTEQQFAACFR